MSGTTGRVAEAGSVLGVDVGWSIDKRTNAACRLDWNSTIITIECSRASVPERTRALKSIADRPLLVAAFDGPLRTDLKAIGHYRLAERLLTQQLQVRIGKPGQSSSPVGKLLNSHANACTKIILETGMVRDAVHDHAIHKSGVVEAFPSSFLGVLIEEPERLSVNRASRSDNFYCYLARSGGLLKLVQRLLPGRSLATSFEIVTHHDERAAVVCALTALCVTAGDYTVVGDNEDGWIVLPPRSLIRPWAWNMLSENAKHAGLDFRPNSTTHRTRH